MNQAYFKWLIPVATTVSLTAACGPGDPVDGPSGTGTGGTGGTGAASTGGTGTGATGTGATGTGATGTGATGTGATGTGATGTGGTGGGATTDPSAAITALATDGCTAMFDCYGASGMTEFASVDDCATYYAEYINGNIGAGSEECQAAYLAAMNCTLDASVCQSYYDDYGVAYYSFESAADACPTEEAAIASVCAP